MKRFLVFGFLALAIPSFVFAEASSFTRDLYFGMIGDPDVVRMQDFLRGQGYFSYPQSTGNYFTATLGAVKKFQAANGISAVGGYFGPQSRRAANRILAEGGQKIITVPPGGNLSGSATTSPYKGKIAIASVSGWSSTPEYESITLENRSQKDSVPITGFQIQNSLGGILSVPQGQELPGLNPEGDSTIFLKPGDHAVITVGRQERHMNFRENLCTGYFDETSTFNPSLSHYCPRPDTHALIDFSDACINIISYANSCRTIAPSFPSRVPDSVCASYINAHFNYAGCVADYRNRSDFYSHSWLIWMQRPAEFFRNTVDHIIVKDQQGKVVDEYSY